jgi:hypothetical protein
MRALLAAGLAVLVALSAAAPHVHAGPRGAQDCAACVVRNADVARSETPDTLPAMVVAGEAPAVPGLPPVTGAPLGAIPGQSPPRAA